MGFTADSSTAYSNTFNEDDVITFELVRFSRNTVFDTVGGFTCTQNGYYQFTLHLVVPPGLLAQAKILKDGVTLLRVHAGDDGWDDTGSVSVFSQCAEGQNVQVACSRPVCTVKGTTRFTARRLKGECVFDTFINYFFFYLFRFRPPSANDN